MKAKKIVVCLLVVAVVVLMANQLWAQGPPPFGGGVNDEPPAPINGLIGLAAVVGAFWGSKKIKEGKKKSF